MKRLARTGVYGPDIGEDIEGVCHQSIPYSEHPNKPSKPVLHLWTLQEKLWSRLHLDHAINFLGSNWLVLTDAYSKYSCIHPTQLINAKQTVDILEQKFSHFGFPHTLVTDNATRITSLI